MAVPNSNYPTDLLSTTFETFLSKRAEEAIFKEIPLFEYLRSKKQVKKRPGSKILQPLRYAKSTTGGSYRGYDLLDVSPEESLTNAEYDLRQYYWTVTISGKEELDNSGKSAMLDLLEEKWANAKMSMMDMLDEHSFLDGTGNNSKNMQGLALLVDSAGTYGNINRSNYAWWQSNEVPVGGPLQIHGPTGLLRVYNDTGRGQRSQLPNFFLTTQEIYEAYEELMAPYLRYTVQGTASATFNNENLVFRGKPFMWDDYCQSGTLYLLNTEYIKLVVHPERDFTTTGFKTPINQDSKSAHIYFYGNLVCSNCARQGKMTGLTNE